MIHQTAGGVLFNTDLDKVYLIHKVERDEWLLPKGHIEDGESLVDAAKREIYEETGYERFVILGSTPTIVNKFVMKNKEEKVISIFTAILTADDRVDTAEMEAEGLQGDWFAVEEAIEKAAYDDIKDAIQQAYEQIQNLSNNS